MDSPKCLLCVTKGRVGQTYHIAHSPNFKCHDCHTIYRRDHFEDIEYRWRENPKEYEIFLEAQGIKHT